MTPSGGSASVTNDTYDNGLLQYGRAVDEEWRATSSATLPFDAFAEYTGRWLALLETVAGRTRPQVAAGEGAPALTALIRLFAAAPAQAPSRARLVSCVLFFHVLW